MPVRSVSSQRQLPVSAGNGRGTGLLLLLLAGSGCSALIYEVVWFQLLQLVIGSSAVSLGMLLASYMGGLCLGSVLAGRVVSPSRHPLRIYAALELATGVLGLLALVGVPLVSRIYVAGFSEGMAGLVLRGIVAGACLLPPTMLMGAGLPVIARWLETTPAGVSSLGYLYSANIAGGVAGCVISGFYLLRVHDMAVTSDVAAGMNLVIAALAFAASTRWRYAQPENAAEEQPCRAAAAKLIYIVIGLSGLSALGAEVVWTRLLSLLLGATVYTFSIILAVFLIGLWAGSNAGSFFVRRMQRPRLALALCQAGLALSIAWTAYALAGSLPYWPVDPWLSLSPWFNFQIDVVRCAWAILPGTLLWGASFPLALAAAAAPGEDPARLSGEIYGANTAGSIIGALAFTLILIPALGTQTSQQLLAALALLTAIVAAASTSQALLRHPGRAIAIALPSLAIAGLLIATISDVPWEVIAYGRRIAPILRAVDLYDRANPTTVLFRGEGINSSVVIAERAGQRHFYVSGKAEASTAPLDMRLERMMGDIPGLIHPQPRNVLVVGFGAGVTAGSFVPYPDVQHVVICELERLIPPASTRFFGPQNYDVMRDPRTHIVYDDARHYIFTTREKFDVITTDPIHPWVKGTSTLYSREYYRLVREHLSPGGVVAQWLPIYDSDAETVKSELATFFDVFPQGTIWSNNVNGDGYDLVLLGRVEANPVSLDALQQRLNRADYSRLNASLAEVGFHSAVDVLATYAGRASDLRPWLSGAQMNDDMSLRLQYLAGMGLNSMSFQGVYREILARRRFPDDLITGEGPRMDALRTLMHTSIKR